MKRPGSRKISRLDKKTLPKKVFFGMSGGVDSSVGAALLKQAGYDVHGVFIKVWQPDFYECTWREDRLDAMRVCAKLDIPFYTLDLEKEYKKEVVDYLIAEYEAGRTPNPDVMCNKHIKFGGFFDWAMKRGADFVATGHYAKIKIKKINPKKKDGEIFLLEAGDDKNKDQSYFLWTLTQKQLSKTLFPVGNIEKPAVRKLAKKFDLPTAIKKDSQGICFIGKVSMEEFLKHFIKAEEGNVLNEAGEIIGRHKGVTFYTIGQRHGFTITKKSTKDDRYFVVSKNPDKNTITVSTKSLSASGKDNTQIHIKNTSWTTGQPPEIGKKFQARIRYRQPLEACVIEDVGDSRATISFVEPQKAVTVGQSLVIYDGKVCLGGGIID